MYQAWLTAIGLLLGGLATIVSLFHDQKPSPLRKLLCVLAILGIGVALITTHQQYVDAKDAQHAAADYKSRLEAIQHQVLDVARLEDQIHGEAGDLTALNHLGDHHYYIVLDTFLKNSPADDQACSSIRSAILNVYPNALSTNSLWTHTSPYNPHKYELRLGRNLAPSSAENYWSLADHGLANGHPLIRREPDTEPGNSTDPLCGMTSPPPRP